MSYGMRERCVMIALAALGGAASNPSLTKAYNLDLDRTQRQRLIADGLISSHKERNVFVHTLTDKGWRWVEAEMKAPVPSRAGSAGGGLYALLHGLAPVVRRAGSLKALFHKVEAGQPRVETLSDQIRAAYQSLAKRPRDWVQLRDLRPRLSEAPRSEIDSALKRMFLDKEVNLTLNEDQGSLTKADRDAAIRIGVSDMHMISMG